MSGPAKSQIEEWPAGVLGVRICRDYYLNWPELLPIEACSLFSLSRETQVKIRNRVNGRVDSGWPPLSGNPETKGMWAHECFEYSLEKFYGYSSNQLSPRPFRSSVPSCTPRSPRRQQYLWPLGFHHSPAFLDSWLAW